MSLVSVDPDPYSWLEVTFLISTLGMRDAEALLHSLPGHETSRGVGHARTKQLMTRLVLRDDCTAAPALLEDECNPSAPLSSTNFVLTILV